MWQRYRSSFLRVHGHRTHYLEAGDGPPLILVHGGGPGASGEHAWSRHMEALGRRFRVYAIDLLGCGESDAPPIDYSVASDVWHLAGLADALCLDRVHLAGNSRGALVAVRYALEFPTRVGRVLMIASASIARDMGIEVPQTEGRRALRRVLAEPSRESMRAFLENLVHDASLVSDELVESRLRLALRPGALEANRASLASAAREQDDPNLWQRADLRHRLPALTIPLCLVWGREDRFAPIELGHRLKERLPNLGEFHVLDEAGHQAQNDDPERFQAIATAFFGAA